MLSYFYTLLHIAENLTSLWIKVIGELFGWVMAQSATVGNKNLNTNRAHDSWESGLHISTLDRDRYSADHCKGCA